MDRIFLPFLGGASIIENMNQAQYQQLLVVTNKKAQIYAQEGIGISSPAQSWPEKDMLLFINKQRNKNKYEQEKEQIDEMMKMNQANSFYGQPQFVSNYSFKSPSTKDAVYYLVEKIMTQALSYSGIMLDFSLNLAEKSMDKIINAYSEGGSLIIGVINKEIEYQKGLMDALKLDEPVLEKYFLESNLGDQPGAPDNAEVLLGNKNKI